MKTTSVHWPGVRHFEVNAFGLVILLSGFELLGVPRRAFGTPEELDAFVGAARGYWEEAGKRAK